MFPLSSPHDSPSYLSLPGLWVRTPTSILEPLAAARSSPSFCLTGGGRGETTFCVIFNFFFFFLFTGRRVLTSAPPTVRQRQGFLFAARPLQLAGAVVAPPVRAAHRLRLCPCTDDPAVAVSVSDQPLQRGI